MAQTIRPDEKNGPPAGIQIALLKVEQQHR